MFKPNKRNKLKIIGAEYKTTLASVNNDDWDIICVSYCKNKNIVIQVIRIKSKYIDKECIIPRKPLSNNAKRSGWQGCYLEFKWDDLQILYKK